MHSSSKQCGVLSVQYVIVLIHIQFLLQWIYLLLVQLIFLMQSRQRGGPPPKGPPANMPGVNSVEFPVPGNKCGLIIGKGESHNGEMMNTKKIFISESVKYLFNFPY